MKGRGGWRINGAGEGDGGGGGGGGGGDDEERLRAGRRRGEEGKKGMTSPPVEREDNCQCLEMLRWAEAISPTGTDLFAPPAHPPTPTHHPPVH